MKPIRISGVDIGDRLIDLTGALIGTIVRSDFFVIEADIGGSLFTWDRQKLFGYKTTLRAPNSQTIFNLVRLTEKVT